MKVRKSSWPMIWTNSFHEDGFLQFNDCHGISIDAKHDVHEIIKIIINTFEVEEDVFVQELDRGLRG